MLRGTHRRLAAGTVIALALLALALVGGGRTAQAQDDFVDIVDFAFDPTEVTVDEGATVEWANLGDAPHTVTSDDGAFDSGTLNADATYSYTFDTAGTYAYHCEIHPSMVARVIVTAAGGDDDTGDDDAAADDDDTNLPDTGVGSSPGGGFAIGGLALASALTLGGALFLRRRTA